MIWNKFSTALLALSLPIGGLSQNLLTTHAAVATTLENNYDIRVARNNVEIARNNTDRGLNGYRPVLDASVGPSATLGSGLTTFDGPLDDAKINNAFSWSVAASVSANYTLFDKARDHALDQLQEIVTLSDLQLRQEIEVNLLQMLDRYYEIARLTEDLSVFEQVFAVSRSRLERAEYGFEFGQGNRLEVLNAKVDIQRDSINLLRTRQQLSDAKRNLNFIMGNPVDVDFIVDTAIVYTPGLDQDALLASARSDNVAVLAADQNLVIQEMDLKIIEAGGRPTIGARAAYDYNYQDNASGSFFSTTRSNGLNGAITLNWNILDGGRRKAQQETTHLLMQNQLTAKEQLGVQLERDVRNAWENYQNALFILDVEKSNLSTVQANLGRTQEYFEAGQVSSVEFRTAQLNLLNSTVSFNNAKYSAKSAELILLQLSGALLRAFE